MRRSGDRLLGHLLIPDVFIPCGHATYLLFRGRPLRDKGGIATRFGQTI